ncbi:hypothetical protein AcV5_001193 [Taiwanofungus camphoratus]|nr:hypothetical protein AcV5_001193 [Antrodia cinnamomea]
MSTAMLSRRRKSRLLSASLNHTMDRVNVLGDEISGHTGCVNALSWAQDGELLISAGDDTTCVSEHLQGITLRVYISVRLWRIDSNNTTRQYPFVCDTVIRTGHRGNIFNAQMLPNSTRIATVSGDQQVRISDVGTTAVHSSRYGGETEYSSCEANVRVLGCHRGRVKRIVTEDSPDLFLTVSEDGTVRQHDLRVPHDCALGSCPAPLITLNHDLSTLALSPLTPYQFIVAGESPYGYLFDRRHAGRFFKEEWGMLPGSDAVTTCVRRFGRAARGPSERRGYEHITGARMSTSNGHEVLLSYSSDAVYLYSTRDDPQEPSNLVQTSVIPRNPKSTSRDLLTRRYNVGSTGVDGSACSDSDVQVHEDMHCVRQEDDSIIADAAALHSTGPDECQEDDINDNVNNDEEEGQENPYEDVLPTRLPVVFPRARFGGACNVETVKDVNFLGPQDEFVVSGSDDGNFFMWRKSTGKIHDILEGDGTVVNVIEGHPHFPLVAVSGIDTTVKLFTPTRGQSMFSRLRNAESIVQRNTEAASRRIDLASLFLHYQISRRAGSNHGGEAMPAPQCTFQ